MSNDADLLLLPNIIKKCNRKYYKTKKIRLQQQKVTISNIDYIGITYENYDRRNNHKHYNDNENYMKKNKSGSRKGKVWFTGRTKANTSYNKYL
ncbi:4125_t:CDS:1, partial [Entrophospora sp. SA101]